MEKSIVLAILIVMLGYEELKQKWDANKVKILLGGSFVLIFMIGFGAGRFEQQWRRDQGIASTNYSTKAAGPAKTPTPEQFSTKQGIVLATSSPATHSGSCLVKGNINSSGKKIYHVKGGAFYNRVKPKQCFDTETQARDAGFVKSQR